LELDELREVTSSVDSEERLELSQEGFALSEVEGFLILDLDSKEFNEGQSDLVVLKSLNVDLTLLASFSHKVGNVILVFLDSSDQPCNVSTGIIEFSLIGSKDSIKSLALSLLILQLLSDSVNVGLKNGLVKSPVCLEIS